MVYYPAPGPSIPSYASRPDARESFQRSEETPGFHVGEGERYATGGNKVSDTGCRTIRKGNGCQQVE